MDRPSWIEYFVQIAGVVSTRSTCPRARCGAVITKDHRILSTGYNGSPSGAPHCTDQGCLMEDGHCQRAIHAEVNAIGYAARHGIPIEESILYVYKSNLVEDTADGACRECMKVIRSAGIHMIIGSYGDKIKSQRLGMRR